MNQISEEIVSQTHNATNLLEEIPPEKPEDVASHATFEVSIVVEENGGEEKGGKENGGDGNEACNTEVNKPPPEGQSEESEISEETSNEEDQNEPSSPVLNEEPADVCRNIFEELLQDILPELEVDQWLKTDTSQYSNLHWSRLIFLP